MRRAALSLAVGLSTVIALGSSAFAECAWVLWVHAAIEAPYPSGVVIEPWRPIGGWGTRSDCEANKLVATKRHQEANASREPKQVSALVMGDYSDEAKAVVELVCLPETVDPRAPRARRPVMWYCLNVWFGVVDHCGLPSHQSTLWASASAVPRREVQPRS